MDVVIAGGHGKIGRRLARLLAARGDRVRGLIRNPAHSDDVRSDGAEPVVCDLESASVADIAKAIEGADAVVFAAGAGPGSGSERKETMDYGGAAKLIEAAKLGGIPRYVMVSSMGADPDHAGEDTFSVYQRAKGKADAELQASGLEYTIVRPGMLTDDPGTGRVRVSTELGDRGEVPRDDVAAVIAAVLDAPNTIGVTFELFSGDLSVAEAVRSL